jgi:hypothetical protein
MNMHGQHLGESKSSDMQSQMQQWITSTWIAYAMPSNSPMPAGKLATEFSSVAKLA